ncbi:basic helix-loop-helix (bHLH) DNA-binding superfamily protein [Actinidia rufa]|uniref:Basic helix-loop-helix (BHLH) DNA-binding superfamily protein n=1 Tax=Actinidia rufa TaxID=165716 RepID=A0A7J0GWI3_9ERIC|nr:basic helix-loop-helix (bHLH) DNA-binding superfamily protein [Actinidia rufa]
MKNAILPSVSSQLYSYGNSEPVSDIPLQMENKLNHVYGTGIFANPNVYNDCDQLIDGGFAINPPQSPTNYQPGSSSLMTTKRLDRLGEIYLPTKSTYSSNIPQAQPLSLCKKISVPEYEIDFQASDARKRPIDQVSGGGFGYLVGNNGASSEWTKNKKAMCFQERRPNQVDEEMIEIRRQRVPGRRSQKLSDKITALQKLVSPYGKTDTASVLQEASISIKESLTSSTSRASGLHMRKSVRLVPHRSPRSPKLDMSFQEKLFQMLSASYNSNKPIDLQKFEEKQVLDLRSRGLCLVPVSFSHKLTHKEDHLDQRAPSWKSVVPRNI